LAVGRMTEVSDRSRNVMFTLAPWSVSTAASYGEEGCGEGDEELFVPFSPQTPHTPNEVELLESNDESLYAGTALRSFPSWLGGQGDGDSSEHPIDPVSIHASRAEEEEPLRVSNEPIVPIVPIVISLPPPVELGVG